MMAQESHCIGPLRIDGVPLPSGGLIGLANCPGRRGSDSAGRMWARDLSSDLDAIEQWGASILVSLIEAEEFARLGVADFAEQVRSRRFDWHHIPIADMQTPSDHSARLWLKLKPGLVDVLGSGGRVVLHCAAGLGRTGTMVAKLLTDDFGFAPDNAIETVRRYRQGAIESEAQAAFIRARSHKGLTVR